MINNIKMTVFPDRNCDLQIITEYEGETERIFKLKVKGRADLELDRVLIGVDLGGPEVCGFFREGYQSWSEVRNFGKGEIDTNSFNQAITEGIKEKGLNPEVLYLHKHHYNQGADRNGELTSYYFGVFKLNNNENLLIGALTFNKFMTMVYYDHQQQRIYVKLDFEDLKMKPGDEIFSETLYIHKGYGKETDVFAYYSTLVADKMKVVPAKKIPTGWCSWYYYFNHIHEENIYQNIISLKKKDLNLEVIQIDDGYERRIGDWLEIADTFPRGMKCLAECIKQNGMIPGIWIAPFIAAEDSKLFKDHRDWLVKNRENQPEVVLYGWQRRIYALDLTNEEVLNYLRHIFEVFTDQWGFHYFKLDFLFGGIIKGIRKDPSMTPVESYRNALKLIRQTTGADKYILGCGAPVGPSIGLFDGMRIGPDIALKWEDEDKTAPAVKNAIRNIINRCFFQQNWWIIDPDCLVVRDDKTALTLDEITSLATAVKLSGGMLIYSDDFTILSKEREELIRKMGHPSGKAALPVNLFETGSPGLYLMKTENPTLLGVFNLSDETVIKEISLSDLGLNHNGYHLYDFWEERDLGKTRDKIIIRLRKHSCKLFQIS